MSDLPADQERIRREGDPDTADPVTAREALETELMDEDASEEGEQIGDELD